MFLNKCLFGGKPVVGFQLNGITVQAIAKANHYFNQFYVDRTRHAGRAWVA